MIRPLSDRVLVEETTEHGNHLEQHGSILLKVNEANLMCHGIVRAIGPSVSPNWVKVGDHVHYRQECGTPVGEKILMFRQQDNLLSLVGEGRVTG